jgi:hypothetical protein
VSLSNVERKDAGSVDPGFSKNFRKKILEKINGSKINLKHLRLI